jgi:hypothetical protein
VKIEKDNRIRTALRTAHSVLISIKTWSWSSNQKSVIFEMSLW